MLKETKLSSVQIAFIIIGSRVMIALSFLPILDTPPGNQDVWISAVLSFFYSVLISIPVLILIKLFRRIPFNRVLEIITGNFFGKVIGLAFSLFFVFCYIVILYTAVVFINSYMFPSTPAWIIYVYIIAPTLYAAFCGAGTLGRLTVFVVPYVILTIVLFFLLGLPKMDMSVFRPVLADSTIAGINVGAFMTGARFLEPLILFALSQYISTKVKVGRTLVWSAAIFTLLFILIMIPTMAVLGVDITKHALNPYYLFSRQVEGYEFIQRVESFNSLGWFIGTILQLGIYGFLACYIMAGVFGVKSHRYFAAPVCILPAFILLIPILNKSVIVDEIRSARIFPWIVLTFVVLVPIMLIVIYFFRKQEISEQARQWLQFHPDSEKPDSKLVK